MPLTRSQTKKLPDRELPVHIDFTLASQAWRQNKVYLGNGCFKYHLPQNQTNPDPPKPHRYHLRSHRKD